MYITPNNMFSLSPIKRKKFIAYYIPSLFGIGILHLLASLEENMVPILIILFLMLDAFMIITVIRRLKDLKQTKTDIFWFFVISFIPFIHIGMFLYLCCAKSKIKDDLL